MNTTISRKLIDQPLAAVLILALLAWAVGVPLGIGRVNAAQITEISDTLSDSDLNVLSRHVIAATTTTALTAAQTFKIEFDPTTQLFQQAFSTATTTDITATGFTVVADAAGCGGGSDEMYPIGNYNDGVDENITFTVCPGDTVPAGPIVITIGAVTQLITNPNVQASYRIDLTTSSDAGYTWVAILNNVDVTASVATTFTFTVAGLANSTTVNGTTTTIDASGDATTIPFGSLTANVPVIVGQSLSVVSNAAGGFIVTVQRDGELDSATGAIIDSFKDGANTATPEVWAAPTATPGSLTTYGHWGFTSEDSDLNGGEFTGTKFAGNNNTPRVIFSNDGPANGTTPDEGYTEVAYVVQVSSLQEAADDYTDTLTYVATPTF